MRRAVQSLRSAGLHFYLKSLSLEVIFSSRLEMWYEALAMSVLLAVSLLLADCAECVCVPAPTVSLSVCVRVSPAVCLSVRLLGFRYSVCLRSAACLSFYRDCRIPGRGVWFVWMELPFSLQRGGVSRMDAAGSKVRVRAGGFHTPHTLCIYISIYLYLT